MQMQDRKNKYDINNQKQRLQTQLRIFPQFSKHVLNTSTCMGMQRTTDLLQIDENLG